MTTIVLFAAAAGLLLFSTIGGIRAALQIFSETYAGHIEMYDIGVSLREKTQIDEAPVIVAWRNHQGTNTGDEWDEVENGIGTLLIGTSKEFKRDNKYNKAPFLGQDADLVFGKAYPEEISVENTGNIDEYVRVTIYKYWTDPDGNKVFESGSKGTSTQGLSPELIKLNLTNTDVWIKDEDASTEERMVFYYSKMLGKQKDATSRDTLEVKAASTESVPLSDTITIDPSVADKVTQTKTTDENGYTTITTEYDYDGWQFCLEAEVDAVQSHNIVDAAKSAWGVDLKLLDNGDIQLAK